MVGYPQDDIYEDIAGYQLRGKPTQINPGKFNLEVSYCQLSIPPDELFHD